MENSHHAPKVVECFWQWCLAANVQLWADTSVCDITRVNVAVGVVVTRLQLDTGFFVR